MSMFGPEILARTLGEPTTPSTDGTLWQYHSRSDRHSKVASWGVAFDMLLRSSLMQTHARDGKIVLGVNHPMTDYATGRTKVLDLVIARPASTQHEEKNVNTLRGLVEKHSIDLSLDEKSLLLALPEVVIAPVGAVLVAMEAKACMTAHVKSLPRLYDELNSSHLCIHGASTQALAIGYVQVNYSEEFISPNSANTTRMKYGDNPVVSRHRQPSATQRVLDKINDLPRRSNNNSQGFDAVGVTVLNLVNDGSTVSIVDSPPAPQPGNPFDYGTMITRMAHEYDSRFSHI